MLEVLQERVQDSGSTDGEEKAAKSAQGSSQASPSRTPDSFEAKPKDLFKNYGQAPTSWSPSTLWTPIKSPPKKEAQFCLSPAGETKAALDPLKGEGLVALTIKAKEVEPGVIHYRNPFNIALSLDRAEQMKLAFNQRAKTNSFQNSPKIINDANTHRQNWQAMQADFKAYLASQEGKSQQEKLAVVEKFFWFKPWLDPKLNTSYLAQIQQGTISDGDLEVLYQYATIGNFLITEKNIQYKQGADLFQALDSDTTQPYADCNIYSTMVADLAKIAKANQGLQALNFPGPPGHLTLLINLPSGNQLYFDNAKAFVPPDFFDDQRGTDIPQSLEVIMAADWNDIGIRLAHAEKQEEAVQAFKNSLNIDPNNSNAHRNLGITYRKLGKDKEGKKHYKKSFESNPKYYQVALQLAWIYEQEGNHQAAIDNLEEMVKHNPKVWKGHHSLGRVYRKQRNLNKAESSFMRSIQNQPDEWIAYDIVAEFLEKEQRDLNKAKTVLETGLKAFPKSSELAASLERIKAQEKANTAP